VRISLRALWQRVMEVEVEVVMVMVMAMAGEGAMGSNKIG
jgi:hypothetical protein